MPFHATPNKLKSENIKRKFNLETRKKSLKRKIIVKVTSYLKVLNVAKDYF